MLVRSWISQNGFRFAFLPFHVFLWIVWNKFVAQSYYELHSSSSCKILLLQNKIIFVRVREQMKSFLRSQGIAKRLWIPGVAGLAHILYTANSEAPYSKISHLHNLFFSKKDGARIEPNKRNDIIGIILQQKFNGRVFLKDETYSQMWQSV